MEGEGLTVLVPQLKLHFRKIHRPGVDPGGRARLKAADGQSQLQKALGQGQGGGQAVGARVPDHLPHHNAAPQIGAGGHHGGLHGVGGPSVGDDSGHSPVLREDFYHLCLLYPQVFLLLQGVLHDLLILPAVGLGPEGPDGGALTPVQKAVLDAGLVRGPGHLPAQGVQLPDQVALPRAADGGVAGHVAHRIQVDGEAQGFKAHPGGGQSGLDACVARPDDGNIKCSGKIGSHRRKSSVSKFAGYCITILSPVQGSSSFQLRKPAP